MQALAWPVATHRQGEEAKMLASSFCRASTKAKLSCKAVSWCREQERHDLDRRQDQAYVRRLVHV